MKKVSEWLAELGAWGIYDSEKMAAEFHADTGETADWPKHSYRETVADVRGSKAGGVIPPKFAGHSAYGYEVAVHLARKYVPGYHNTKMGRGFAFDAALDALRKAGK